MNFLRGEAPADNSEFRQALYQGAIFKLPPTDASLRLIEDAGTLLQRELGDAGPIRTAQFALSDEDFFERMGRLRKQLYSEPRFHEAVCAVMASLGFDPARTAFDPLRLRVNTHRGFENPRAAPIYYAHRDTWYAHSQAEITWWIPLHDVTEEETFVFYPDWFDRAVHNNSEAFDYDDWVRNGPALRIGWQNRDAGIQAVYPGHIGELEPGRTWSFACKAGEIVLFAGAHFHQTRKNTMGQTRFSTDFRTVDREDDAKGRGAPNVDNRSTGSALRDFLCLTRP